jgi:uncharacterized membrane protein
MGRMMSRGYWIECGIAALMLAIVVLAFAAVAWATMGTDQGKIALAGGAFGGVSAWLVFCVVHAATRDYAIDLARREAEQKRRIAEQRRLSARF